jgi:hypothetical protein
MGGGVRVVHTYAGRGISAIRKIKEDAMFCPKCRGEYREGFTRCADCDVPLTAELPPESTESDDVEETATLVEVFSTFNEADISLIKSILDGEEIIYDFQGEFFHQMGISVTPVRLLVPEEQAERVRDILRELDLISKSDEEPSQETE